MADNNKKRKYPASQDIGLRCRIFALISIMTVTNVTNDKNVTDVMNDNNVTNANDVRKSKASQSP